MLHLLEFGGKKEGQELNKAKKRKTHLGRYGLANMNPTAAGSDRSGVHEGGNDSRQPARNRLAEDHSKGLAEETLSNWHSRLELLVSSIRLPLFHWASSYCTSHHRHHACALCRMPTCGWYVQNKNPLDLIGTQRRSYQTDECFHPEGKVSVTSGARQPSARRD